MIKFLYGSIASMLNKQCFKNVNLSKINCEYHAKKW